jgi:hypothetical protein
MPNLHVIIGDSNTRKSSLLRCLTGVGGGAAKKRLDVALVNGNTITVYCILSALQEGYKPKTPNDFIAYIRTLKPRPTDIAITLRVKAVGIYPDALAYLQAFSRAHWPVANIALLGSSACTLPGMPANAILVPNSDSRPTNETSSLVRRGWGWI